MAGLFAGASYFDYRFQTEHPRAQFRSSGRKRLVTYFDVHQLVESNVAHVAHFAPDVILAVGGGGVIPARILRTFLPHLPLIAISANLYNDVSESVNDQVEFLQWVDDATADRFFKGKRVMVVDDIDDSRATLTSVLQRLQQGKAKPSAVGTFVLFSKESKTKPEKFPSKPFIVAERIAEKTWVEFPWEVTDLERHEEEADRESCMSPSALSSPRSPTSLGSDPSSF
jgi:hypoxanthine phosphoribosyltransferase